MSVSLTVEVAGAMSISDLASASTAALSQLLLLDEPISLLAAFDADQPGGNADDCLRVDGPMVICSMSGRDEAVRILAFAVPVCEQLPTGEWTVQGEQRLASVERHRSSGSLGWILVAAVAAAIARASSSEVGDTSGYFTKASEGLYPDALIGALACRKRHASADDAADAIYARMNKSAEVSEWLRSLDEREKG